MKFGSENVSFVQPRFGYSCHTPINSSGLENGRGRKRIALMTLNIAVFAPMPSASVSTATAVKQGFFSNWRKAKRRSAMVCCPL